MVEIVKCSEADYAGLVGIWERSVRATHDFLDEEAIREIRAALVPCYFPQVDLYAAIDAGRAVGFTGLRDDMIEMLFVDGDMRGSGYGSALIDFALRNGATRVDVNEQNPAALAFYRAKGFTVVGRDETDPAGRPYPIIHLSI